LTEHELYRDMLAMRDELSAGEQEALTSHLDECPICRELGGEYGRQDAFLRALSLPEPPLTLKAGVLGKAHRTSSRRWWRHSLGLPSAAAVVVLLILTVARAGMGSNNGKAGFVPHGPGLTHAGAKSRGAAGAPVSEAPRLPSTRRKGAGFGTSQPPNQGDLAAGSAYEASATSRSNGLLLTLILPRSCPVFSCPAAARIYDRGAVVPVTVTARNVSKHLMSIFGVAQPGECWSGKPGAEVVGNNGQALSAWNANNWPEPACPILSSGRSLLYPGQQVRANVYVVLRSNRVRAVADILSFNRCDPRTAKGCRGERISVHGPVVTVALLKVPAPRIQLRGNPPTQAIVQPTASSPLWSDGWYRCRGSASVTWTAEGGLGSPSAVRRLTVVPLPLAGCDPKHLEIHLAAGFLYHPVAHLDYVRP
jgi:hypothetical protein